MQSIARKTEELCNKTFSYTITNLHLVEAGFLNEVRTSRTLGPSNHDLQSNLGWQVSECVKKIPLPDNIEGGEWSGDEFKLYKHNP